MTVGIRAARGDQPVPQRTGRVISRTGAQLLAAAVGIVAQMWTPMVTAGPRFGPVVPRPSGHAEQRWAVEHRTPTLDTVTHIGSMTADTIVALAATVGELLIFLVITATAHRARPAVPQLDQPGAPHVELSVRPHRGGDRAVRVSRGDPAAQRHTSMGRCQPGHARIPHPHRCGSVEGRPGHALPDRRPSRRARQRHLAHRRAGPVTGAPSPCLYRRSRTEPHATPPVALRYSTANVIASGQLVPAEHPHLRRTLSVNGARLDRTH